jgi:hypothetical protein
LPPGTSSAGASAYLVQLQEPLAGLSPALLKALANEIARVFQQARYSVLAQPGEFYLNPGQVLNEREPLQATLHLDWNFSANATTNADCLIEARFLVSAICALNGQNCLHLCMLQPWQFQPASLTSPGGNVLLALAIVRSTWDLASVNGRPFIQNLPANVGSVVAPSTESLVLLRLSWSGTRWRVELLLGPALGAPPVVDGVQVADDPACTNAETRFSQIPLIIQQAGFTSGPNPAEGCLVNLLLKNSSPEMHAARFLDRFGAPRPLDRSALHLYPGYPQASDAEQTLAGHLENFPGQSVIY